MRYEYLGVGVLNVDKIIGSGAPAEMGIGEKWYLDGTNGSNGNSGKTAGTALKTLAAAESACVASQNDCVLAMPAAYLETAELAWDKANTHLFGISGPNSGGDWSEPNVVFYTTGTAVASVITVTGANCRFENFTVSNYGDNAACLTAFTLNKYGCYFKNVAFQGVMTAGTDDVVAAASLYIDGDGMYPEFHDCIIGQNVWDTREGALSGMLRFTNTSGSGPQNGLFRGCRFLSGSETATVAMVAIPVNYAIGRNWQFDDCHFDNFSVNHANSLNQVFYDNCGSTHDIILRNSTHRGFSYWSANNTHIFTCQANAASNGGEAIAVATS